MAITETNFRRGIRFLFHPTVFFWLAILLIVASGRWWQLWKEVWDPRGLIVGLVVGVVLYYGTLWLVQMEPYSVARYLRSIWLACTGARPPVARIVELGGRALYEEAFWRGTIQVLLGNGLFAVLLTACLFVLRHMYLYGKSQRLTKRSLIEFSLFSLLLGVLYMASSRLMLVVAIHFVRNLLLTSRCCLADENRV